MPGIKNTTKKNHWGNMPQKTCRRASIIPSTKGKGLTVELVPDSVAGAEV